MKTPIYNLNGEIEKEIELPFYFDSKVRPDLILRAVLAIRSTRYQPYGKSPSGDKKHVVESHGKGYDESRVSRTGGGFGIARFVALAVGGRRVRAPKSSKVIVEKINKKEKFKALVSALAATKDPNLVQMRGHIIEDVKSLPLIVNNEVENISKTKDVRKLFEKLGVLRDIVKAESSRRIRAGKGKRRGRRYKRRKSILLIVSGENENIIKAARNLEGVDVVPIDKLSVEHLAPGGHPGRLTIITERALELLTQKIEKMCEKFKIEKELLVM